MLTVSDSGVGLPATIQMQTATSLGMQLIRSLTKQLGGKLTVISAPGTTVSLRFPREYK